MTSVKRKMWSLSQRMPHAPAALMTQDTSTISCRADDATV